LQNHRHAAAESESFRGRTRAKQVDKMKRPPQEEIETTSVPAGEAKEAAKQAGLQAFGPGDVLADRYRVIRFIAKGGMGEVYEAEDLTLGVRVALKTIRPEIATNPISVERFKREINIARRITHPNVSRIYDLGINRGTSDTMFLTMEFLAGDTLSTRLTLSGKMTEGDCLPLVEQIAAGLAAAHEAGVIHRDFKSANVMLVPNPNGAGVRAVVTDFGLARTAESDQALGTLSEADAIMGTPAYMAPEQVEGHRLTPAADIYAFGVVLYEMVTGKRPFAGDTPLSMAVKRLTETPVPPRELVPSLEPAWDAVIMRCLQRDPSARFATALDVAGALHSGETPTLIQARGVPVASANRTRWLLVSILVAAAITTIGIVWWPAAKSHSVAASAPSPSTPIRRGVAVLGLSNNSGRADAAWLSTAISEMLATELGAGGKIRIISGEQVARVKADLGISDSEGFTPDGLQKIHNRLDAESLVLGSYTLVGQPDSLLRINLRLLDAASGKELATSSTSGTEAQLFDLVSRAGARIRQQLGLGDLTSTQAIELEASIPSNRDGVRYYTEGIAKLRSLDATAAVDSLTKAVSSDNKHPLIHAALSEAYSVLGNEAKAKEEASRAVALSEKLGPDQKLQIEAGFHKAAKEWGKAVDAEKSLFESFPDNIEYGLNLANSQISAGKTKEALVTIETLRKLPSRISGDGRIDLVESRARQEMGDFAGQKAFAAKAATKGRATGSRLLVARARMLEASATLALGDLPGTTAAVDEARSLFEAAGDRSGVARALELTARTVSQQGDLEGERKLLEQALVIHRQVGDSSSVARVLSNIGKVLFLQGRTSEAQKYFDDGLATFRQIGAKFPAALTLNNIGAMMFNRGDLPAAQKRYSQALTLFTDLGDKWGTAMSLTNIAEVLECKGDLDQAREMHEESLALNRAIGEKGGSAYDLLRLGEIYSLRGELVAARDRYQEALSIQNQIADKLGAADSRVALASLAIEQGHPAEAEKQAREAEEILRTEGAAERSVLALAVIAQSLLAQGKQKEAFDTASRAWKQAEKSEDRRVRFSVAVALARARAASKNPSDVDAAIKFLEAETAEASRSLFIISEMDTRLALGEIEIASGRTTGKQHLAGLEKDAKAKGFDAIARRAAAGST